MRFSKVTSNTLSGNPNNSREWWLAVMPVMMFMAVSAFNFDACLSMSCSLDYWISLGYPPLMRIAFSKLSKTWFLIHHGPLLAAVDWSWVNTSARALIRRSDCTRGARMIKGIICLLSHLSINVSNIDSSAFRGMVSRHVQSQVLVLSSALRRTTIDYQLLLIESVPLPSLVPKPAEHSSRWSRSKQNH